MNSNRRSDKEEKGLIWKLPQIKLKDLGKVGPAFGAGIGCGVGVGVGLVGGIGIGPGFPGLQFGAGFGAGCGIGVGFGYGLGKGVAHDEYQRYSNVGTSDVLGSLVDELAVHTKKIVEVTSREIEKWRNS